MSRTKRPGLAVTVAAFLVILAAIAAYTFVARPIIRITTEVFRGFEGVEKRRALGPSAKYSSQALESTTFTRGPRREERRFRFP